MSEPVSPDPRPYFRAHVFCCTNERPDGHPRGCCKARGAEALRDQMKKRATALGLGKAVRINTAGCLDRCELGPVMVIYPEGVWYSYQTAEDVEEILQTHLVEGKRVQRLLLQPEDRLPADRLARLALQD
ncbi:(2Fe-2S) ferredoxin domain-containing protein [Oleisolibacter albus]|uniref:(2Fe-2S) ferredoxin domain-containing protein n=1 Tax=Oleisolibacter albus TaxID=2171757 RepID=UPI000DF393AB|nr:(2Fe-2S) ferredoxin domain-containing protein [Oleisolibacter albus]